MTQDTKPTVKLSRRTLLQGSAAVAGSRGGLGRHHGLSGRVVGGAQSACAISAPP